MKGILQTIIMLSLICTPLAMADDLGLDGNEWVEISEWDTDNATRQWMVKAFYDGLYINSGNDEYLVQYYTDSITSWRDLADAIDKFYSNDENRTIYLRYVLPIIKVQIEGASQQRIDEMLTAARAKHGKIQ